MLTPEFGLWFWTDFQHPFIRAVWAPWLCIYLCDTWGDLRSNQNQTPAQHKQSPEAVNQSPRSTARFWVTRHKPNLKACKGGNKLLHFAIKQVTQVPTSQKAASNRNSSSAVTPSHWHKKKKKERIIHMCKGRTLNKMWTDRLYSELANEGRKLRR